MIKWLLVIGVVVAVYYLFIKKKPVVQKTENQKTGKTKRTIQAEEMVQCTRCDVYVEIKEAILGNGKYYCSQECLRG